MLIKEIQSLKAHDYVEAYARLETFATQDDRLLMLGQFGEVRNPSISDLDIFVCYKDEGFIDSRQKLIKFVRSDSILNYLCSHDPLIIPLSMLRYLPLLHTVYGIRLSFNRSPEVLLAKSDSGYGGFLNVIWATSLIPAVVAVLAEPAQCGDRYKLLLLKNVHQSIANFDALSGALERSLELRNKVVNGQAGIFEIDSEFREAVLILLKTMDEKVDIGQLSPIKGKAYKVSPNVTFALAEHSGFELRGRGGYRIALSGKLFSLFEDFFYLNGARQNLHFDLFVDSSMSAYAICQKYGFAYPFAPPFYFAFFRNDLKFKIRKIVARALA